MERRCVLMYLLKHPCEDVEDMVQVLVRVDPCLLRGDLSI